MPEDRTLIDTTSLCILSRLFNVSDFRDFIKLSESFALTPAMPVVFVGHGSPMNAIEESEFSAGWKNLGATLPRPRAILCVSAHWETAGTYVTSMERPETIHDFYGFPQELFAVRYPAPGDSALARLAQATAPEKLIQLDTTWGLDHGCWSVLRRMYPGADVPVVQLSLDRTRTPQWHYELAGNFSRLRDRGILLLASGNIVHNLGMMRWDAPDTAYDWADEVNGKFKSRILDGNPAELIDYRGFGRAGMLAVPTPEHFLPMLYAIGLRSKNESVEFFNDKTIMGSISMTSFIIH
jgi:4,5-DOPA dioxygenase extradiol